MITITEFVNQELDQRYNNTAGKLLSQVNAITHAPKTPLQKALRDLDAEAARLDDADARITTDNPYLDRALTENGRSFEATQTLITANDDAIQASGASIAVIAVTAKVFRTLAAQQERPISKTAFKAYVSQIADAGIKWNVPSALDFATNYVDSSAWLLKMEGWGSGYDTLTRDTILTGVKQGWSPKYTASQMRRYAENLPYSAAENLTRTLQVTSYRDASAAMELMNGGYIIKKIRVSALKDTSCLTCVALHGTELAPGERVNDHYNGLCSEEYVVPGGPDHPEIMQADSKPGKRNFVAWQTGPEWFNSLPPERQRQQASFQKSPAKWRAFQAGTPLEDFIGSHNDDVFGAQTVELSLVKAIGDDAEQYYTRNQ